MQFTGEEPNCLPRRSPRVATTIRAERITLYRLVTAGTVAAALTTGSNE